MAMTAEQKAAIDAARTRLSGQQMSSGQMEAIESARARLPQPQQAPEEWKQVPGMAMENLPQSAKQFAGSLYEMVTSPIETLDNLTKIGAGALQLGLENIGLGNLVSSIGRDEQSIQMARKVGEFFVDRYGSEQAAMNTLATDPVGAAADVAGLLTGTGGVLRATGKTTGIAGLEKAGDITRKAGGFVDPTLAAARAAGKVKDVAGLGASELSGLLTGTGGRPIREAYKSGKEGGVRAEALTEAMRGRLDPEAVVGEAQGALKNMQSMAAQQYRADKSLWQNDAVEIPLDDVYKAIDSSQKAFGSKFDPLRGVEVVTNPKAQKAISDVKKLVDEWAMSDRSFRTPEGIDDLKQSIWGVVEKYTEAGKASSQARTAAENVWRSVRSTLDKNAPGYSKAMENYTKAQDEINSVKRELSLKGKDANVDTALRKLLSTMRSNVATNYGSRAKRIESLREAGAEKLIPQAAGAALEPLAPRGIARAPAGGLAGLFAVTGSIPELAATALLSSPRIAGETAYAAGKAARPVGGLMEMFTNPEILNLMYQAQATQR